MRIGWTVPMRTGSYIRSPEAHRMLRERFFSFGVTAMTQYLFMCPTLTWAQRTQRTLERAGISASVVKAPQRLTEHGCGYAVSLTRRFDDALNILRKNSLIKGKIYYREENGEFTEIGEGKNDLS